MISWKLTTDFNEQRHLFYEKIKTDYKTVAYICACGHTDFIIQHATQEVHYQCLKCENSKFYDANSAWQNIGHFLSQNPDLEFSYEYNIQSSNEAISSLYMIQIPHGIDFLSANIIFSKKPVYSLTLTANGELKENYSLRFKQKILQTLKKKLTQYIATNSCFNIPDSIEKNLNLAMALFFLKNKHLRDFDFYYWANIDSLPVKEIHINAALKHISNYPKAKAIKKAVYQNYINQLDDNGKFYSFFIEVLSRHIKDVNIIVQLLNVKLDYTMFSQVKKEDLNSFMQFLTNQYTDKQILKLFSSDAIHSNQYLFRDTVDAFNCDKEAIERKFRKVSCRVQSLHDELVRCSQEERYNHILNQVLTYKNEEIKPCIEVNTYQVKLPKSGKELFDWSQVLHNCMAIYFDKIKHHETMIYGFFEVDVLVFAVEIKDGKVAQASSKYNNANLTAAEYYSLTKWFELFFKDGSVHYSVSN